nr:MAG TPA: hypothetical protein [Caudoviricetes sp.]
MKVLPKAKRKNRASLRYLLKSFKRLISVH